MTATTFSLSFTIGNVGFIGTEGVPLLGRLVPLTPSGEQGQCQCFSLKESGQQGGGGVGLVPGVIWSGIRGFEGRGRQSRKLTNRMEDPGAWCSWGIPAGETVRE